MAENFEGGIKAINDFYIQNKRYPTQQEVAKLTVLALPNYAAGNSYLTCFTNGKQYFTLSYSIGGYTSPHEGIDIPAIFNKYSSMTDKIEKSEVPLALSEFKRILKMGGRLFISVKEGKGERMVPDRIGERFFSF